MLPSKRALLCSVAVISASLTHYTANAQNVSNQSQAAEQSSDAAQGATLLETIILGLQTYLGGGNPADTGTTELSSEQFTVRTEGGGDANSFLRGLPNVQYQNDTDTDAGVDGQAVLNTKPLEVSISGGRTYENNFIIDGIASNTVTGTVERYGSSELTSDEDTPNADRFYGLHPQTIFVPTDFVDTVTVIDSNASAKYGNFQGGVVSYTLSKPDKKKLSGSASVSVQTDDFVNSIIATETGENPLDRKPPEFYKIRSAFSVSAPINEIFSAIAQYSRTDAHTTKQKDYEYYSSEVEEESLNQFYRLQLDADTEFGNFKLEGMATDYHQDYESPGWRDLEVDVETKTYAGKLEHSYDFDTLNTLFGSISDLKLTSQATVASSETRNVSNNDTARAYQLTEYQSSTLRWTSTELSDWCRVDPTRTAATTCRDGGYGPTKVQSQLETGFSQELNGSIWNGTFEAGYDLKNIEARRAREGDFIYYTASTTLWDARTLGLSAFNCATTEACSSEQYASTKSIWRAFDTRVSVNTLDAHAQLEQTYRWITVRPGVRVQYDDYQRNLNLAPRLIATVKPIDMIEMTAGFNRYFNAASLAYAIRDNQPRGQSYTRTHTSSGTVSDVWTRGTLTGVYGNRVSDLDTPYTDEWTGGIKINDPFTGGQFRARYIDREMKEQYAKSNLGSNVWMLTNTGTGAYQSFTAEYAKDWQPEKIKHLDKIGFTTSITWSAQELSSDTYFYDETDFEDRIYYKGTSYSLGGFSVVTGNMDIPLRLQAALSSTWLDGSFDLGFAANYNFPYKGAGDTGDTIVIDGISHDVWEDMDFDPTLTVDLHTSYKLIDIDDRTVRASLDVSNLFNTKGNKTASNSNPFVQGRSFWLGLKATF